MIANSIAHGIDRAVETSGGLVWKRLHSEREDVCEALLKDRNSHATPWHHELLQSRLRKIDDALDRLMSGSYGSCAKCGRWIEDTKLDFDPSIAFCIDCWGRQQNQGGTKGLSESTDQTRLTAMPVCRSSDYLTEKDCSADEVKLDTLARFDTVCARTHNSDYRIFMLNPRTGRALIEGGSDFAEPVEGTVTGSQMGPTFKAGWIGIGLRIEFWADGKIVSTSPVQSFHVEHCKSDEVVSSLFH